MTTPTDLGPALMGASTGGEMTEDHIGRAVPGWQGMDSAPKDGTAILALLDLTEVDAGYEVDKVYWDDDFTPNHHALWVIACECQGGCARAPRLYSHWMPLPDPPEVTR